MTQLTLSVLAQIIGFLIDKLQRQKELTKEDKKELLWFLKTKGFTFSDSQVKQYLETSK